MRNCNCSGGTCGCKVNGGVGVTVTGTGTAADPYVINNVAADLGSSLTVSDTLTLDLSKSGSGTNLDPLVISGQVKLTMSQLTDVNDPTGIPLANEVPTYVGVFGSGGHWEFKPGGSGGGGSAAPQTFAFSHSGELVVGTGTFRLYNDTGSALTVSAMRASLGVAPGGSAAVFQPKKNGSNFGSAVSVAAGSNTQVASGLALSWPNGDYLTLDTTAIGSPGTTGSDATFTVVAT